MVGPSRRRVRRRRRSYFPGPAKLNDSYPGELARDVVHRDLAVATSVVHALRAQNYVGLKFDGMGICAT